MSAWTRTTRCRRPNPSRPFCSLPTDFLGQVFVILDLQVGLFGVARDFDATLYRNAMYAHAELAKVFDVPVVMTTSAEVGE